MQRGNSGLKNLNIIVKLTTIIVAKPDLFTPKPIAFSHCTILLFYKFEIHCEL